MSFPGYGYVVRKITAYWTTLIIMLIIIKAKKSFSEQWDLSLTSEITG